MVSRPRVITGRALIGRSTDPHPLIFLPSSKQEADVGTQSPLEAFSIGFASLKPGGVGKGACYGSGGSGQAAGLPLASFPSGCCFLAIFGTGKEREGVGVTLGHHPCLFWVRSGGWWQEVSDSRGGAEIEEQGRCGLSAGPGPQEVLGSRARDRPPSSPVV